MADESNPWAWNAWAQTQDPGLYGWNKSAIGTDSLAGMKPLLQQAGLWNPEWDSYANWQPNVENGDYNNPNAAPDLNSLNGYQMGGARSTGSDQLTGLFDPTGNMVAGSVYGGHKSATGADYASMLATIAPGLAGPLAAAYGGGMVGAAASGATLGAAGGAMRGQGTDGNMLGGALKGGLLGGIGGAAGNYFSGGELQSGMDMAADTPIDWSKINPGIDMTGFDNSPISLDTSALDQAVNRQPLPLDQSGTVPDISGMDLASDTAPNWVQQPQNDFANITDSSVMDRLRNEPLQDLPPLDQQTEPPPMPEIQTPNIPSPNKSIIGNLAETLGTTPGVIGGIGALVGAIGGSHQTPGSTSTTSSRMDPRMDAAVYGSGGLLGAAQDAYNATKSPNADMQAGWNAQRGLLQDPTIAAQLAQFRTQGAGGLLGAGIAGNPFTQGQMKAPTMPVMGKPIGQPVNQPGVIYAPKQGWNIPQ